MKGFTNRVYTSQDLAGLSCEREKQFFFPLELDKEGALLYEEQWTNFVGRLESDNDLRDMDRLERQRFLDSAARVAPRYHVLFSVLAGCGLRLGEGLGLQADDLDLPNKTIRVVRSLSDDGTIETPKNGHGRDVYMSGVLVELLRKHLVTRKRKH